MKQGLKTALYAAVLLALPFAAAVAGAYVGDQREAQTEAQFSEMMSLIDAAATPGTPAAAKAAYKVAQSNEAPRGRRLDAPKEEAVDPDSIPSGSPIDPEDMPEESPDGVPPGTKQIREISDEAWEMLQKLEGDTGDGLNFEKTPDGQYTKVTFSALGSFEYELPDPDVIRESADPTKPPKEQIPSEIKDLDAEPVVVVGFMVPIEIDREGKVKSFALTQNQAFCCYGVPPGMNEWIMVEMEEGKTAPFKLDLPVATYGQIDVGEEIEDGYILSIYRMTGGEVIDAHELLRRTRG